MKNPNDFKIRCSSIGKIMTPPKKTKDADAGLLGDTAKSCAEEWFHGEYEPIKSKYLDKGIMLEDKLINFCESQLPYFDLVKNEEYRSDDYITGTPDIIVNDFNLIIDVKCAWSLKTLYDIASNGLNKDYYWQMQGYMHLFNKDKAIVFHGLLNTPAEINYGHEVIYENLPANERFVYFEVERNDDDIKRIVDKVVQCRIYLNEYASLIKSNLGHKMQLEVA